eukprot:scaffold940_cov262-Pinguiococcus_pyrenoidosus.AAC.3
MRPIGASEDQMASQGAGLRPRLAVATKLRTLSFPAAESRQNYERRSAPRPLIHPKQLITTGLPRYGSPCNVRATSLAQAVYARGSVLGLSPP